MKEILAFLRFTLSDKDDIPNELLNVKWDSLYDFAQKQAIIGVLFNGLQKLDRVSKQQGNSELYFRADNKPKIIQWMAVYSSITKRNEIMFSACTELYLQLQVYGINSCILKGQGNNTFYPDPFERVSGDIDVWTDLTRQNLIRFIQKHYKNPTIRYRHAEVEKDGVVMEFHFHPVHMNNPIFNHRLQRWFNSQSSSQWTNMVMFPNMKSYASIPTVAFSLVQQLAHVFQHELTEGIGMRQIIDYYYLLKANKSSIDWHNLFKRFGLLTFAQGMMWVQHEILGLDQKYLLVVPNEKAGKVLLDDIVLGGNFGMWNTKDGLHDSKSHLRLFFMKIKRNFRFFTLYPLEVICEPFTRVYHILWRLRYNLYNQS